MMAGRPLFALKLVLAAAIVWLQAYSLAHAAEHCEESHQHDGVECDLTVFATEDMGILPEGSAGEFVSPAPALVVRDFAGTLQARNWPPERGPPPRGPPL